MTSSLEGTLDELVSAGRTVWSELTISNESFRQFLRERFAEADELVLAKVTSHISDVYLAYACARHDDRAMTLLETHFIREVEVAISHMRLGAATRDEIRQLVREKILVGNGTEPAKIAGYSGRGSLRSWIRAIAARTAIDVLRVQQRHQPVDEMAILAARSVHDPELALIQERYKGDFQTAFREALGALTPRHQLLLRQYYVDGLTTVEIATLYRIHPVTAVRRLGKVRDVLRRRTQRLLKSRLQVTTAELNSIVRAVKSQLDVSIVNLLNDRREDESP